MSKTEKLLRDGCAAELRAARKAMREYNYPPGFIEDETARILGRWLVKEDR